MITNQSVEFKTNCWPDMICRQVCAFLNSSGGYIVCGVDHQGKIIGIGAEENISTIEKQLEEGLSPKALVSVKRPIKRISKRLRIWCFAAR